jgi:DNA-directed RNA polymerase specialized sigma24 family protein
MAKNIANIASRLGAVVVGSVPETGGGAFGAARLASLVPSLRSKAPDTRLPEIDPAEAEPPELVADLMRRAIALVRGEFEDSHRLFFEQLTLDKMSISEVAATQHMTVMDVSDIKSRVFRRIRARLEESAAGL